MTGGVVGSPGPRLGRGGRRPANVWCQSVNFGRDPGIEPVMEHFTVRKGPVRFAALAGLTLLAVPSLSACRQGSALSSSPSAQPSESSSPAASSAAPSAAAPTASPSSAAAGAAGGSAPRAVPACRAADLHVSIGQIDGGAGQRYTTLQIHTLHERTCVLRNDLTDVHFIRGDGARMPTHVRRTGDTSASITLHPDMDVHLALHYTDVDPGRFTPRLLEFTVPGGGQVTVAWPHGETVGDNGMLEIGRLQH